MQGNNRGVPAIVDPLIEQGFKQSLNLPVLPRATGIYFVVKNELGLQALLKDFLDELPAVICVEYAWFLIQSSAYEVIERIVKE